MLATVNCSEKLVEPTVSEPHAGAPAAVVALAELLSSSSPPQLAAATMPSTTTNAMNMRPRNHLRSLRMSSSLVSNRDAPERAAAVSRTLVVAACHRGDNLRCARTG